MADRAQQALLAQHMDAPVPRYHDMQAQNDRNRSPRDRDGGPGPRRGQGGPTASSTGARDARREQHRQPHAQQQRVLAATSTPSSAFLAQPLSQSPAGATGPPAWPLPHSPPQSPPSLETQRLPPAPQFSWSQTPASAFGRPQYVLVDPGRLDAASPTTIDETSPVDGGTGSYSHLTVEIGLDESVQDMAGPDGRATYSLYPRNRTPSQGRHASRDIHPAHFAPYDDTPRGRSPAVPSTAAGAAATQPSPMEQYQRRRSLSNPGLRLQTSGTPPPLSSNDAAVKASPDAPPVPASTISSRAPIPLSTVSARAPIPISAENKAELLAQTPSMSTPHMTPRTPTYNPDALLGPNGDEPRHMPGQISHPNAVLSPTWQHGLCEADLACLEGIFCPCVLYGKTQYRLDQKTRHKEATDLLGYSPMNGHCAIMAFGCGFQWLLALIQRARVRKLYHLDGSFADDCVKGFCCCACVLAQDEREVRAREAQFRQNAGPSAGGYVSVKEGMVYAPPPR